MPRLPEAPGERSGIIGDDNGDPFRLLVFGESTAAGVGAASQNEALGVQTALALAARLGRPVAWRVVGKNGVTAQAAAGELLPQLTNSQFDLVAVALGANDVFQMHSAEKWRRDLLALLVGLRYYLGDVPIFISGMPPIGQFPVLRRPLRTFLGYKARLHNEALRLALDPLEHVWLVKNDGEFDDSFFGPDRFHPGPKGYKLWAERLADTWVQLQL